MKNFSISWLVPLLLLISCSKQKPIFIKLDSTNAGIDFENKLNPTEDFNIIDYPYFYNGGGVAVGDINNDGLPDIFFSANQTKNQLYLNKGNLKFENITETAGVGGNSSWNTGSVMADINGDGLLDIYVCAVVGIKNLSGHNELYINNGNNTFTERSEEFGLDFESFGSSAAFLDYDLDGDLDMYLLNHAVHTPQSFGHANLRNNRTYETGGKLLRNDGNSFVDVSEEAKIYGGVNGYGLGVSVSDFNSDGYPDVYVGNDFHEDDYLYLNNKNGSFTEVGKESLVMMSKFSMGNDAADINHDGLPDLITLDMLPNDETILKRSVDEEEVNTIKLRVERYGYHYQYPRNMLQVNAGNGKFVETGLISGVAATDWSWSALFSDFDLDGNQDLFVSNGIVRRPNDLDYIKYVSSEQVVKVIGTTKLIDEKALALMPSGKAKNFVFKGSGDLTFNDQSSAWLPDEETCSTATALADLDNDGDIDIILNNVDDKPSIYINQTQESNFLKIRLAGEGSNRFGIGTKIFAYQGGVLQFKEMYSARGFQSSSEPIVHLGFGRNNLVDSLRIQWPDGRQQKLYKVETNQTLVIQSKDAQSKEISIENPKEELFQSLDPSTLGLNYAHVEDAYTDFDRLKLLPYQQSDKGPATAIGDINNDGLADLVLGGSKYTPTQVYVQSKDGFKELFIQEVRSDSLKEGVEAILTDFNKDSIPDLFVGSGGADFYGKSKPLLDSYYLSNKTGWIRLEVADYFENASCLKAYDYDGDEDLDLFVGNESVSDDFGKIPKSYLLENRDGVLQPVQQRVFEDIGMVTDAVWDDYNADGWADLIVVGEWMEPLFIKNNKGVFQREKLSPKQLNGLWQSILPFDIDQDGDMDYVLGNWGTNTKFQASASQPMQMYYNDFDDDGKKETILAIAKNDQYYPFEGFDRLAGQMPSIRKKFLTYKDFAGKRIEDVFATKKLKGSKLFEVHRLASGYLKNNKGTFEFIEFPLEAQLAPVLCQIKYDFDNDGKEEVLMAGNYFGVQPIHGRLGSFPGAILNANGKLISGSVLGLNFIGFSIRHLNVINIKGEHYLLATVNNGKIQVYKIH